MENANTMSDHDILITLVATVNEQHKSLLEKMEGVKQNIKDIKDVDLKEIKNGTHERIVALEIRVASMEKLRDETNYPEVVKTVRNNNEWISSFKISWKTTLFIVSTATAVVTFILSFLLQLSNLLKLH